MQAWCSSQRQVQDGFWQQFPVSPAPISSMTPRPAGPGIPGIPALSAGSHGHPEMCHRPCVYMMKSGHCHLGSFCDHCHLPHAGPSLQKLDKKQRIKLKQMRREDVMALLLPHIRHRAAASGLAFQTRELMQLLEEEKEKSRSSDSDEEGSQLLPREIDRFNHVLSRLPFSALAARLASGSSSSPRGPRGRRGPGGLEALEALESGICHCELR